MALADQALDRFELAEVTDHEVRLDAGGLQAGLVIGPQLGLAVTQEVQVVPGEDAGAVAIGERGLDGVVAHRRQIQDADLALAGLQRFLAGPVALHLGRRRVHAHQLERNAERSAVRKGHLQHAGSLVHRQCGGQAGGHFLRERRAGDHRERNALGQHLGRDLVQEAARAGLEALGRPGHADGSFEPGAPLGAGGARPDPDARLLQRLLPVRHAARDRDRV